MRVGLGLAAAAAGFWAGPAQAARAIDGKALGLVCAIPSVGIFLSIPLLPQLAHRFWDRHMGALSGFWALLVVVPLVLTRGFAPTLDMVAHVLLTEYLPFLLLLIALFTIAGGLVVVGNLHGSPALNMGLLAFGTLLA